MLSSLLGPATPSSSSSGESSPASPDVIPGLSASSSGRRNSFPLGGVADEPTESHSAHPEAESGRQPVGFYRPTRAISAHTLRHTPRAKRPVSSEPSTVTHDEPIDDGLRLNQSDSDEDDFGKMSTELHKPTPSGGRLMEIQKKALVWLPAPAGSNVSSMPTVPYTTFSPDHRAYAAKLASDAETARTVVSPRALRFQHSRSSSRVFQQQQERQRQQQWQEIHSLPVASGENVDARQASAGVAVPGRGRREMQQQQQQQQWRIGSGPTHSRASQSMDSMDDYDPEGEAEREYRRAAAVVPQYFGQLRASDSLPDLGGGNMLRREDSTLSTDSATSWQANRAKEEQMLAVGVKPYTNKTQREYPAKVDETTDLTASSYTGYETLTGRRSPGVTAMTDLLGNKRSSNTHRRLFYALVIVLLLGTVATVTFFFFPRPVSITQSSLQVNNLVFTNSTPTASLGHLPQAEFELQLTLQIVNPNYAGIHVNDMTLNLIFVPNDPNLPQRQIATIQQTIDQSFQARTFNGVYQFQETHALMQYQPATFNQLVASIENTCDVSGGSDSYVVMCTGHVGVTLLSTSKSVTVDPHETTTLCPRNAAGPQNSPQTQRASSAF